MESNVTQETLLKVMDEKTFRKLKMRGVLIITRPAPCMTVKLDSVPNRYRRKLNASHV